MNYTSLLKKPPTGTLHTHTLIFARDNCARNTHHARAVVAHVVEPGGAQIRICKACFLALRQREQFEAVRVWLAGGERRLVA